MTSFIILTSLIPYVTSPSNQVGYGDMYPVTALGKLVTSVLVFCSMVFLALPMTIIVSKFNKAFETLKKPKPKSADDDVEELVEENGSIGGTGSNS